MDNSSSEDKLIRLDTPASYVVRMFKHVVSCDEKDDIFTPIDNAIDEGVMFGDVLDVIGPFNGWILMFHGNKFDQSTRLKMMEHVSDPMYAFQLYITQAWVTSEDEAALEKIFKGKLPHAEKELRGGKISRNRNSHE